MPRAGLTALAAGCSGALRGSGTGCGGAVVLGFGAGLALRFGAAGAADTAALVFFAGGEGAMVAAVPAGRFLVAAPAGRPRFFPGAGPAAAGAAGFFPPLAGPCASAFFARAANLPGVTLSFFLVASAFLARFANFCGPAGAAAFFFIALFASELLAAAPLRLAAETLFAVGAVTRLDLLNFLNFSGALLITALARCSICACALAIASGPRHLRTLRGGREGSSAGIFFFAVEL